MQDDSHPRRDTLDGRIPAAILADLRRRHAEPQRAYHDWSHVEALLALHGEVRAQLHDPAAVLWAILFHDAIYDPRAADNEERSARLLEAQGGGVLDATTLARAAALVRATATHMLPDSDDALRADAALFLDMDLSILAAPADRFRRYDAGIRREYAHVPDGDFAQARARILAAFLARPRLFLSDWGRDRFEAGARDNLRAALDALRA